MKEFQIERTNVNDVTVQAKLDSLLTKNVLDANLTIENKNDRKVVKSGTDLIVAVKFLKVTSKTPYDIPCNNCPIKIVRDNSVKQFDQTTKKCEHFVHGHGPNGHYNIYNRRTT